MKKNIAILVTLFVISFFVFGSGSCFLARAEQGELAELPTTNAYAFFTEFVQDNPNRTVATEYENIAANYIANKLEVMGYGPQSQLIVPFEFEENIYSFYSVVDTEARSSQNVIAYKRSSAPKAKLLVIGAKYGNLSGRPLTATKLIGGEGAYDNGTGVGALIAIADVLLLKELPFDVALVFFGAEDLDFAGSLNFIRTHGEQQILGMINLAGVGGGDNLYAYYDEVGRTHGDFLNAAIKSGGYNILAMPRNRKLINIGSAAGIPYTHKGLESSNAVFMYYGIPSVNLFGYNWEGIIASESATRGDITGGDKDTLDNFLRLYGEEQVQTRLSTVTSFVLDALEQDGFEDSFVGALADNRSTGLTSGTLRQSIKWTMIALLVVGLILLGVRAERISKKAAVELSATAEAIVEEDVFDLDVQGAKADAKEEEKEDIFDEF